MNWIEDDKPRSETSPNWIETFNAPIPTRSTYTPEIGERICERIANGDSVRSVLKDEGLPSRMTWHRWLKAIPGN
jgi:hypothetical protein